MSENRWDEGRYHIGERVCVIYLIPNRPIEATITEMAVADSDGRMYARCDDGSGDTRWFLIEELEPLDS